MSSSSTTAQENIQDTIRSKLRLLLPQQDWETTTIRQLTRLVATSDEETEQLLPLVRSIVLDMLRESHPSLIPFNQAKEFFTGLRKPLKVDRRLEEILHCGQIVPRTQVVKYLHQYIKEHQLQDPEHKNRILLDDALSRLFGEKTATFFSLNKLISPFLTVPEENEQHIVDQYVKEHLQEALLAAETSKRKRKRDKGATSSHRGESLQKPLKLSSVLSQICGGAEYLSRCEVVKKIWEYIKERELQNPNDKRMIICDDLLKQLFEDKEQVNSFHISKYLSPHLQKI